MPITSKDIRTENIRTSLSSTTNVDVVVVQYSKNQGETTTTTTSNSNRIIEYVNNTINWSIIIPIVVTGVVLLIVATCLYWHSRKDQRRMRELMANQGTGFNPSLLSASKNCYRSSLPRDSARSVRSSRSRDTSLYERISIAPLEFDKPLPVTVQEGCISESLSQKLSTIGAFAGVNGKASKIVGVDSGDIPAFSFNNTSWLTSQSVKDNRTKESFECENPYFSAPGKLTGNRCDNGYSPDNSPFFPNHNTPTTDFDRSSDRSESVPHVDSASLSNMASFCNSNPTTSYPLPPNPHPSLEAIELSSIAAYPEVSFPAGRNQKQILSHQQNTTTQMSSQSSYTDSTSDSLSLPSSISRYHASRLYNASHHLYPLASTQNCSPMKFNFTLASSIEVSDHYSDNTSMLPCVGSSIASADFQATTQSNPYESISSEKIACDNPGFQPDCSPVKTSSAPATRRGSIAKADVGTTTDGRSSFGTNLYRSWSVTADLDLTSFSHLHSRLLTPLSVRKDPVMTLPSKVNSFSCLDNGQSPIFDINQVSGPGPVRKVKFSVPVLVKKQYWV